MFRRRIQALRDYLIDSTEAEFFDLYELRTHCSLEAVVRHRTDIERDLKDAQAKIDHIRTHAVSRERKKTVGSLQQRVQILTGQLRRAQMDEEAHALTRAMIHDMYYRMLATPRVVNIGIDVKGHTIHITTDVLYGRHGDGTWHRFNPVHAELRLPTVSSVEQGAGMVSITWRCPRGITKYQTKLAPQVVCGQLACLGSEATSAFKKALGAHDYAGMVSIVPRFAECFGNIPARDWPRVDVKDVPEWYLATFG